MQELEKKLSEVIEKFQNELKSIRTGRANPKVVEDLIIEYFGAPTPLKQAANISAIDARTIVISPWSKDSLVDIEKAINESDLGITPVNDGEVIRLTFPALTEERRKEIAKLVGQKAEEARIKIRQIREKYKESIEKEEKESKIGEDEKIRQEKELQKIIDKYNQKVEEIQKEKEEEIMTV